MMGREDRLTDALLQIITSDPFYAGDGEIWIMRPVVRSMALELQELRRAGAATGRVDAGVRAELEKSVARWTRCRQTCLDDSREQPEGPVGNHRGAILRESARVLGSVVTELRAILDAPEPEPRGDFAAGLQAALRKDGGE